MKSSFAHRLISLYTGWRSLICLCCVKKKSRCSPVRSTFLKWANTVLASLAKSSYHLKVVIHFGLYRHCISEDDSYHRHESCCNQSVIRVTSVFWQRSHSPSLLVDLQGNQRTVQNMCFPLGRPTSETSTTLADIHC